MVTGLEWTFPVHFSGAGAPGSLKPVRHKTNPMIRSLADLGTMGRWEDVFGRMGNGQVSEIIYGKSMDNLWLIYPLLIMVI